MVPVISVVGTCVLLALTFRGGAIALALYFHFSGQAEFHTLIAKWIGVPKGGPTAAIHKTSHLVDLTLLAFKASVAFAIGSTVEEFIQACFSINDGGSKT